MTGVSIFIFILGLVFGSFIASFTWRFERRTSREGGQFFLFSRSKCPNCGAKISWYDNIPILSFFILGGKCRKCRKSISIRYPIIEGVTALVFLGISWNIARGGEGIIKEIEGVFGPFGIVYLLLIALFLIAIAVVDFERTIIPDELVVLGIGLSLFFIISFPARFLSEHFLWAAISANFLLILHVITKGRGMGLGDVKLAVFLGLFAGSSIPILFLIATVAGAFVGVFLVMLGKANMGHTLPFGPFLVFGTFVTLIFWGEITKVLVL